MQYCTGQRITSAAGRPLVSSSAILPRTSLRTFRTLQFPVRSSPKSRITTLGLGGLTICTLASLYSSAQSPLLCQSANTVDSLGLSKTSTLPSAIAADEGDSAASQISIPNLSFGAVAGICTGVFVAKGLKAVAFILGGLFITLQYLSSQSLAKMDWNTMSKRYDTIVDKMAGAPSTARSAGGRAVGVYNRFVDFLMADFPPRATFTAGFVLGLRLGS